MDSLVIFGGSFNPVTSAHIEMANHLVKRFPEFKPIHFMPTNKHTFGKEVNYSTKRLEMLKLIESENIKVFDYEIENNLSGGTYEISQHILKSGIADKLYFIVGGDCVLDFPKWRNYKKLLETVNFIIFPREGYPIKNYPPSYILIEDFGSTDISSSSVRERIQNRQSIAGLVPKEIETYIVNNHLYEQRYS